MLGFGNMGDSTLDDKSSVDEFTKWMDSTAGMSNLRGGERVISQTSTVGDVQIDLQDDSLEEPKNSSTNLRDNPVAFVKANNDKSEDVVGDAKQPPTMDSSPQGITKSSQGSAHSNGGIGDKSHELFQASYGGGQTLPRAAPVVSIAHKKVTEPSPQPSPKPVSTNKLDYEPPQVSMTPTQQKLLQRKEEQKSDAQHVPQAERRIRYSETLKPLMIPSKHAASTYIPPRAQQALQTPSPNTRDASFGSGYDPMAYYNNILSQLPKESEGGEYSGATIQQEEDKNNNVVETVKPEHARNRSSRSSTLNPTAEEFQVPQTPLTVSATADNSALYFDTPSRDCLAKASEIEQETAYPVIIKKEASTEGEALGNVPEDKLEKKIDLSTMLKVIEKRRPSEDNQDDTNLTLGHQEPLDDSVVAQACSQAAEAHSRPESEIANHETPSDEIEKKQSPTSNPTATTPSSYDVEGTYRTLLFRDLPCDCDFTLLQSLIYGCSIDIMSLDAVKSRGVVKVTNAIECQQYLQACGGLIQVKHNRKTYTVSVELSTDLDPEDPVTKAYLACGATRVLLIQGAEEYLTTSALYKLAKDNLESGDLELIEDRIRQESRSITIRCLSINDAVTLRNVLTRHNEWKDTGLSFTEDPCVRYQ